VTTALERLEAGQTRGRTVFNREWKLQLASMCLRSDRKDEAVSGGRAAGTAEWLEFVRQQYALTEGPFVRDLGGNFNLNLQVCTEQGALVVRVVPEWVEADRLTAVRAVREYLRGRGWPIARRFALERAGRRRNFTAASWRSTGPVTSTSPAANSRCSSTWTSSANAQGRRLGPHPVLRQ
jgi:hypothetical protein